jgi:hypothetical protein
MAHLTFAATRFIASAVASFIDATISIVVYAVPTDLIADLAAVIGGSHGERTNVWPGSHRLGASTGSRGLSGTPDI